VLVDVDLFGQRGAHLARGSLEVGGDEDEVEAERGRGAERDEVEGVVAADEDEAAEDGGGDVVGVEAADGLLGLEPREDEVVAGEARAEEGVDGLGGGGGGGRGRAEPRAERQALGKVDGDGVGADAEGAERGDGGDARAVAERVLGEAVGEVGAGRGCDGGDGDGGGRECGVEGCGDGVAQGEGGVSDGASEEVEARAEVGDGGWREGRDGLEDRGGIGGGGNVDRGGIRCSDAERDEGWPGPDPGPSPAGGGEGGGGRGGCGSRRRRRRHCSVGWGGVG